MAKAHQREPVAIIGVGLRLPGAESLDGFWQHLDAERSLIREVPAERWNATDLKGDPARGNKTASIWGGFVDDADCFDAEFFGISPREAAWMDPQQRFALEMAWHAIEDAGYRAGDLAGSRTGVYMGVCHWDYAELLEKNLAHVDAYMPTGIAFSIIANRVSHFFDFQGPSITNDTACAASMTSLFEAVRALQDGTCDLALAGGVNLIWSPNHFVAFSKAGMLSRDGRSKAFDDAADGYVRGEGGAVLLLKPLARALADNDPIHAVIRGIGINHGGRTNSLTVTNPAAQARLITEVHREAGVDQHTVSYVEAHGPGTPLGDPIEITGLKTAFAELAGEGRAAFMPESCGIGSVKTNIGHLEGAAGVAGVVKVLACLKHQRLPANVGFGEPNRLIDLSGTPFRLQKSAADWSRAEGAPRRACVSSFGFGGSNAHVLLEEPPARPPAHEAAAVLQAVPLSAPDEERLRALAADLLQTLESAPAGTFTIADLALTFQAARTPMAERRVFLARDAATLADALRAFLGGQADAAGEGGEEGVYPRDMVAKPRTAAARLLDAARAFAGGEDIDWPAAGKKVQGRRIHAPLTPFARTRHWMDLSQGVKDQAPAPHPLLHRNLSGFERSRFETRLTGDEFVLADHQVNGRSVLPGVACLEMARAAARLAGGLPTGAFAFENIVWTRPVSMESPAAITVETDLTRLESGDIRFEVRSVQGSGQEPVTSASGTLRPISPASAAALDLDGLRRRLAAPVAAETCYANLRASGVDHGPSFRALAKIHRGKDEAQADVRLPRRLQPSLETMPLHPVLMDAAIQAWIATCDGPTPGAAVPFACGRIEVLGPCEAVMVAHVRLRSGSAPDAPTRSLDIDLADRSGALRVAIRDLTLRVVSGKATSAAAASDDVDTAPLIIAEGAWEAAPLDHAKGGETTRPRVLLAGSGENAARALARRTGWSVEALPDVAGLGAAEAAEIVYAAASGAVRDILAARPTEPVRVLVLAPESVPMPVVAPLAGLLKTAAIENPKLNGRVVTVAGEITDDRLRAIAGAEAQAHDRFPELTYDAGGRRLAWRPGSVRRKVAQAAFEADPEGVYLITGGLGGLGRIFAGWLVDKGARRLVLTGRRATPDAEADTWLSGLRETGAEVVYRACDVSDSADVKALVRGIAREQGVLKGILHAAGVLDDGYILTQDPASAAAVFAPKLAGTVNLDEATRHLPLDLFVSCSSIASVFGTSGQAVYAAANAFLDAYADQRAEAVAAGEASGRSVAIAWPLWAEGGMSVDPATLQGLKRRLGLTPLPKQAGLSALEDVLMSRESARATVLHGDPEQIGEVLGAYGSAPAVSASNRETPAADAPVSGAAAPDGAALRHVAVDLVRGILADVLEMDPDRIRANRKLEEYGLDSIAIVEATNRLEEALGPLSKTLFFEFVDLEGVAGHLAGEHGEALARLLAQDAPAEALIDAGPPRAAAATAALDEVVTSAPVRLRRGAEVRFADASSSDESHDIAVIGLSLHVSGADTQEAFWRLLSEGLHGFEPVPSERWDNSALHHDTRDILGKTVVKTGAFLPDIDKFDPRYFRISQAEAELMSPEVRLFLQASVEAFEDAGYSRETMARRYGGDIAVIVGSMTNEYDLYGFQNMLMRGALASGSYTGTVPNMVSYYYGFTGPSYFLDTMCSASSTCVHEAVHMLRSGRCRMALAGGVSLLLHPQKLIATSQEHFTSRTADVIRGYGLGADGTILGEGVGALVLKPLAEAERDGDHIYGVITGTGISNAGVRNGFTVPSPNQQAVAIERALDDAGISPRTIGYIEGHGSGTALGDPIEVKALTQVFRKHTDAVQTCPIGTVKSNVAHLLGASGLAGIVKVLAQLKHQQLAPSLHAETLNPDIPFETSPFRVQRELAPWNRLRDDSGAVLPLRAGVTSIGAGGMNSHIILEEHLQPERAAPPREPELLVFSGLTPDRLREVLRRFAEFLEAHPDVPLADVAFTLQIGKNELTSRLALVTDSYEAARAAIETFLATDALAPGMVHVPSILDADPPSDGAALEAACDARRLEKVAAAWCQGAQVDWDRLNRGRDVRRVSLPAYPFEKIRCWYREQPDALSVVHPLGSRSRLHPFIGQNRSDVSGMRYRTALHLSELRDYVYQEGGRDTVLPLVAADIAAAAARLSGLTEAPRVSGLRVLPVPDWAEVSELEISVEPGTDGGTVRVATRGGEAAWTDWVRAEVGAMGAVDAERVSLEALRDRATEHLDAAALYALLKQRRFTFGPYLETIDRAWRLAEGGVLVALRSEPPQQDHFKASVTLPAAVLGAALQALILCTADDASLSHVEIAAADVGAGEAAHLLCRPGADGTHEILLLDTDGAVIGSLSGVRPGGGKAAAPAGDSTSKVSAGRPEKSQPGRQGEWLQERLRAMAADILRFAPSDIGVKENFHDLGFDSISLTRYAGEISEAFGIDLTPAIFFECEHIDALASHLAARHGLNAPAADLAPAKAARPAMQPAAPAMPARAGGDVVVSAPAARSSNGKAGTQDQRIAIIGMAGRFPKSPDLDSFFDHLLAGDDLTSALPLSRYSPDYAKRLEAAGFARHGGFLEDIDRFDAALFKVSPVEAERLDPQQRLLLETAVRTLEDAGYRPQDLPRDTGVFIGVTALDYAALWRAEGLPADGYVATGNSLAMTANRLSHQFDLSGPSQAVDTACSSSLVALLRARDALLAGRCTAAIAGGVNLCLALEGFDGPHQAGMLSPSGRCHSFGAAADGYARGEGVATLLLKRLADAERDGDRIHGVIAGGAENHGGRSGALTAPNARAQARLIVDALGDIDPASIDYIEAHGTGTALGDPVEVNGLRLAFDDLLGKDAGRASIALGTVKSNIGHLEASAGIAGVVKVLMAMRRQELPPSLHSQPQNPHLRLEGSPFRIVTGREPWPAKAGPRRAGVSSFGFGGANAHVVLESHDAPSGRSRRPLAPTPFASTRFWLPLAKDSSDRADRLLFAAGWRAAEAAGDRYPGRRIVIGAGVSVEACRDSERHTLDLHGDGPGEIYKSAARQLLALLQRETGAAGHDPVLIQLAVPAGGQGRLLAGLGGMLRSAALEEPRLCVQVIELAAETSPRQVATRLQSDATTVADGHIRYESGLRHVRDWTEIADTSPAPLWRDGGVYLIAGGMGGLGRLIAEAIARQTRGAVLVLAGSGPLDADRESVLAHLRKLGAVTAYRQVDLRDGDAVRALVAQGIEVHGRLDAVFHTAGVLRDGWLPAKIAADLDAVLAVKVDGALALQQACAPLDQTALVLFSSLAGPFGNPGQADYAAANGFLDALAEGAESRVTAIDWPLWQDGGMRVDDETRAALYRRMGQHPLGTQAGLEALHLAVATAAREIAVVAGLAERIREFLAGDGRSGAVPGPRQSAVSMPATGDLRPRLQAKLAQLFAGVSGLAAQAIDPGAPLEDYGIDSLMITRLNARLDDIFEALPKTLFFRHRTLGAVAGHLIEAQPEACARWIGAVSATAAAQPLVQRREPVRETAATPAENEPIAIIGLSGAYPDAPDLAAFWQNLVSGHDAVREIPDERWDVEAMFEADPDKAVAEGKSYSKWGAFLEGFADFDPLFFKLSPRDAAAMDPHERLFLTHAWLALEDAGYTRARLKELAGVAHGGARVGVFAGITKTGYALHGPFRSDGGAMVRPTTSFASVANRVSHVLDLAGPSLPVDTMCSSSLTALHEACEHLRSGGSAMAIAGGVNLYLHPANYAELSAAHMLSPSGRCRSFGAGADGFVPGEGVGCVVLKPLSRALEDGDRIHGLIRASAVNHGGRTNGYTVPSPDAQRDVIRAALDSAGLSARDISLIEAHGTGTDLGDPIEVDGLSQAFSADSAEAGYCALGSVKSSIGHLEAAAGIAGVTRVLLQMRHSTLTPSLHAEMPNPNIALERTPFHLQRLAEPWTAPRPRRAGVSSFGAGGANAHVILEEWPGDSAASDDGTGTAIGSKLIVLSARDESRLRAQGERLLAFLQAERGNAPVAARGLDEIVETVRAGLARLLDVDAEDIDPDDSFDALGLGASLVPALQGWCRSTFGVAPHVSDLDLAGSARGLAALLKPQAGVGAEKAGSARLADIAHTLQVGREQMESRLAIVARTSDDLRAALSAWLSGGESPVPVAESSAHTGRGALAALAGDEVIHEVVARAWSTGRLETVARLWAEGVDIDWSALSGAATGRIVSLPGYPFEKTRFWLPDTVREGAAKPQASDAYATGPADPLGGSLAALQGDEDLRQELESVDAAVSKVLKALLISIPAADVVPAYRPWLAAAQAMPGPANVSGAGAWAAWEASRRTGLAPAQMALAEAALRALPEILTGRKRATDALFPDGRQTLVEAVYKENRIAARFSHTVGDVAARIAQGLEKAGRKLRILEIGAGTGGTSEKVFDALASLRDRIGAYLYTDVSRSFLIHAERSYPGRVPGLGTALLDIDRPLDGQGVETGQTDIVVAANVLHATADIMATLGRVREILAPGGLLLLNETSRATCFTHVTFGLLDGWWKFTDPERRIPGTPSLTADGWRAALEASGFEWIEGSTAPEQALGQQIVIARARTKTEASLSADGAVAGKTGAAQAPEGRDLRGRLLAALGATLNMAPERIALDRSFADFGLDSILGAEFAHRLRQDLGIDFQQTALFDFASVARLEQHLRSAHPVRVATLEALPTDAAATAAAPSPVVPATRAASAGAPTVASSASSRPAHEPIAIVGASGRFAGSPTMDALFEHLKAGDDLVEPVSRFDLSPYYRDAAPGSYGRHGSFLKGIECFDPVFFGISGVEATYMDPQQRLFLEEAWKTLENAGHAGEDMIGRRCGVFVGCAHGDYQELFTEQPPGQAFWGNTTSLIPARISYWLDLKGPAVAIDTACSSSLVALHAACQSLRAGDCDMALAGGVFVQCSPRFFRYANAASMLSPTGRCAAFGAGADGIVPGEAVGAVLLRPLTDALADGDTVLGVIAASGTNQDGTTNGITAPSAASQERLIRQVYQEHHIDPASIDVVEAHGTGTVLGDPIEHAALLAAYRDVRDRTVYLGSVKSNIGHATTAAGIAGLAKVLMSLKHGVLPPTLHFAGGNPAIDFGKGPFRVNSETVPWTARGDRPRRAAISSFGFSGTNAHVVIEDTPPQETRHEPAQSQLITLSARTVDQLRLMAGALADHLGHHPELDLADVAFTLIAGRRSFSHRLALVAADAAKVMRALRAWLAGTTATGVESGEAAPGGGTSDDTRPALVDGERRTADLARLGRHFIGGGRLDASALFTQRRRRVPLPTYPFAAKRYWVTPEERAEAGSGQSAATAPDIVPTMPPVEEASGKRHLADPAAMAARTSGAETVRSGKVQLRPLAVKIGALGRAGSVRRRADRDGVRVLDLAGPWDAALASDLARELAAAGNDETVRALVLIGEDAWQADGGSPGFDPECAVTCAVPVVAALQGPARGEAGALAVLCDFVVSDTAVPFEALPQTTSLLASEVRRRRLDATSGLRIVEAGQVEAAALELAGEIAEAPREALRLLKNHMRADLPLLLADLPGAGELVSTDGTDPSATVRSRPIPLQTDVMRLELFEDGVVLLTMLERDGRNMFTPAFMDGIEEAFDRIAALGEAKAVVLTGHDSYFACGGTRDGLADLQKGGSRFTDRRIYSLPIACDLPVIAAMQGHAIGAGWSLGLYCDQAILAAEALCHSNYLWYGFTPGAGATMIFPHRLGDDLGREVLFSARQMRGRDLGARSARMNVRPGREVLDAALSAAHWLARMPRETLVADKARVAAPLRARLGDVLSRELAMHETTFIGNADVAARIAEKFGLPEQVRLAPESAQRPAAESAVLRDRIIGALAEDLMTDRAEIRDGDSFIDLGLDSILAVTFIRNLNQRFGIALPATAVYAHPTVGALTAHVIERVGKGEGQQVFASAVEPVPARAVVAETEQSGPVADSGKTTFVDPALRAEIIASLAEDLMIDASEITDGAAFIELGLDSILAVTFIRTLNQRYGISLPATAVYAHPTVGSLLAHLASLLPYRVADPAPSGTGPTEIVPETTMEPTMEPAPVPPVQPAPPVPAPAIPAAGHAHDVPEPIAIIGASGRFPKAADLETYWSNIAAGRDCIEEVPASRWDITRWYDADPQAPGKTYCKWMGALDDIDAFDAGFFNITPREAELMDPQQRLFLQTAWHAIEDAALNPASLAGSNCGIYVSSGPSGYEDLIEERNTYSLLGSSGSILAARIAYLLDLRGPCLSIDTACSSSLVAMAEACEALGARTCDLALAGGACVLIGPKMFIDTAKVGMLSPDGRCYSFDERANGFVPGEGVGAVVLKRLADARRDGDPVHAVIRGWGVNQDGKTNGITAPNPKAQTALMRSVQTRFGIDPASISLVECHGTGTALGDPIEVEGLTDAYEGVPAGTNCALGSVKSNIGHLLASAGIAGALKAMLALEHGQVPPSINIATENGHIPFAATPFRVSRSLSDWPDAENAPRRAAVSSFGFSGTNAHLVLEAPQPRADARSGTAAPVLVLSARARDRLIEAAATLERFVSARPDLDLDALAATLQTGRALFRHRLAFVFTGRDDLLRKLASVGAGANLEDVHLSSGPGVGTEADRNEAERIGELLSASDPAGLNEVARLWVNGHDIAWPASGSARLHLPGYAFAPTRHWVRALEPAPAPEPSPAAPVAALGTAPAGGEIGRVTQRVAGDEPFLTAHVNGARLITGLFLPEMARQALEKLSGQPVTALEHLVWGRPLAINGRPRDLTVTALSDEEGLLYRVEADGAEDTPWHLGSVLSDARRGEADSLPSAPAGTDVSETFRAFAELCSVRSGPPAPEMAQVRAVCRDGNVLTARLAFPRGTGATRQGLLFDPYALDAAWRLLAFRDAGWVADAGPANALPFPLSIAAIRGFMPLSGEAFMVTIGEAAGGAGATLSFHEDGGAQCLRLEGVRLTSLQTSRDISFEEEGQP